MANTITRFAFVVLSGAAVFSVGAQSAFAAINTQLDFGSTGANVTTLQTYLSTDSSLYPSGLVTGYFGSMTQDGVEKFQVANSIVSSGSPSTTGYGRVGPTTLAALNARFAGGVSTSWDTVPVLSPVSVQYTPTTANYSFSTNELTTGQVYWSTSPIQSDEATGPNQVPYISGTPTPDTGGMLVNHNIVVTNLQSNTTYYYVVRTMDRAGNITLSLQGSFHTN